MEEDIDRWKEREMGIGDDSGSDHIGELPPGRKEEDDSWSNLLYEEEEPAQDATDYLSVSRNNFHNILKYVNERLKIYDISHRDLKMNPDDRNNHQLLQNMLDLIRIKENDFEKMDSLSNRISKLQCDKANSKILLLRRRDRIQGLTIESNRRKVLISRVEKKAQVRYEALEKEMKALELRNRKHHQKNSLLEKKIFKLETSQQEQKERMLKIVDSDRTDPLSLLKKKKTKIRRRRRGNLGVNSRTTFLGSTFGSSPNDLTFGPPSSVLINKRRRVRRNGVRSPQAKSPSVGDHRHLEVINQRLWKHGLARNVNNLYRNIVGAYEDQRHELSREIDELKATLKTFFTELTLLRNIFYSKKAQRVFHTEIEEVGDSVLDMPYEYSADGIREIGMRKLKEIRDLLTNEGFRFDHQVGVDDDILPSEGSTPAQTPSQKLFRSSRSGKGSRRTSATTQQTPVGSVGTTGGTGKATRRRREAGVGGGRQKSTTTPSFVSPTAIANIEEEEEEMEEDALVGGIVTSRKKKKRVSPSSRKKKKISPTKYTRETMCRLLDISFSNEHGENEDLLKDIPGMKDQNSGPRNEFYVRQLMDLINEKMPTEEDREHGIQLLSNIYRKHVMYTNLLFHQFFLLRSDLKNFRGNFTGLGKELDLLKDRAKYIEQREEELDVKLSRSFGEGFVKNDLDSPETLIKGMLKGVKNMDDIDDEEEEEDDDEDEGEATYMTFGDDDTSAFEEHVEKLGKFD